MSDNGYNNHQINIIYKGIYSGEITETNFKGLEGDWISFEWIDTKNIHKYKIYPDGIQDIIDGSSDSNHLITNLIKNKDQ